MQFQSTSPVWGMTAALKWDFCAGVVFQSTSPVWGMTADGYQNTYEWEISIHIPRVGDDNGFGRWPYRA